MKFSVVIPTYNGARFIRETVESALNQTRPADEVLIHDDNSNDETLKICAEYLPKIRIIRNSIGPSGFVNAWNQGIELAKSEYISVLHQDDILYPNYLEEIENALKIHPTIEHIFSICDYIDDQNKIVVPGSQIIESGGFTNKIQLFSGNSYVKAYQKSYQDHPHIHRCPGVVTNKSIFRSGCIYNPLAGHIADDDFFYRVGQYTSIVGIIKPLAAFRIHKNSETGKTTNLELIRRLATDYAYQVNQWKSSSFMDKKDKAYFEYWALKYLFRLSYFSIFINNVDNKLFSMYLYKQIDKSYFLKYHPWGLIKLWLIQNLVKIIPSKLND